MGSGIRNAQDQRKHPRGHLSDPEASIVWLRFLLSQQPTEKLLTGALQEKGLGLGETAASGRDLCLDFD